jgi:hypothetical protein
MGAALFFERFSTIFEDTLSAALDQCGTGELPHGQPVEDAGGPEKGAMTRNFFTTQ